MESNTLPISSFIPLPPIPDQLMQPSNTTLGVSPELEAAVPPKKNNKTSPAWAHYKMMKKEDGVTDRKDKAICNYCLTSINCDPKRNGTTALTCHLKSCKRSPCYERNDKRQRTLAFKEKEDGGDLVPWRFNQERARIVCVKMIIRDELPFSHVEKQGFMSFMTEVCPNFRIPKRKAIAKGVMELFLEEKIKLMSIFQGKKQRVSVTTDTWTSIQNVNYLVLTAHFMDDAWKLHKRIINFAVIANHKGDSIGQLVERCLMSWGIEKVFTITVDNASSNDVAVDFMKKRLAAWKTLQLGGEFLHLRCCCHILNLIVQDGIEELNDSIQAIRNAVRYIRHSSQRLDRFREVAVLQKMDPKANVGLDVPTRWNSTYLMLVGAKKYEQVFERLADEDAAYGSHFVDPKSGKQKMIGPPNKVDWENAQAFINFLKIFYEATLHLSATKTVTSNQVLHEFTSIQVHIQMHLEEPADNPEDVVLCKVANIMKLKFDKYWGKFEKVNQLMLVANVLDPRWKMEYIPYCYNDVGTNEVIIENISFEVKELLMRLYNEYMAFDPVAGQAYREADAPVPMDVDNQINQPAVDVRVQRLNRFVEMRKAKKVVEINNEVDKYLMEAPENPKNVGFELCAWWKENAPRYPVLSKVAKDVFAIPVSTVASESAFSLGKRIVDPFRSSLTPKMVEALVCCSDWLRADEFCFFKEPSEEEAEFYALCEEVEEDMDKLHLNH